MDKIYGIVACHATHLAKRKPTELIYSQGIRYDCFLFIRLSFVKELPELFSPSDNVEKSHMRYYCLEIVVFSGLLFFFISNSEYESNIRSPLCRLNQSNRNRKERMKTKV